VEAMVNIHNPLTTLLCFGTPPKIGSSNYTINSIWLSEEQAAQMCNFGRKHQKKGCSGVGTRGNGVPTPPFGVGTRSHTFLH